MTLSRYQCIAALGLAMSVSVVVGCSSQSGGSVVTGTVTFDGDPVADGLIFFIPIDGATSPVEATIAAGRYEAIVPPGEKRVEINASKTTGTRKLYNSPDSPTVDVKTEMLPARYNANSELRVTVVAGEQDHPFDLKSR